MKGVKVVISRTPKDWALAILACLFCLCIGTGLALIIGRTQPTYWIVFGGNTDPGDGNGGGAARDQFVGGGWTDDGHIFQVTWQADITQNTTAETNAAMPAAHAAYDAHCHTNHCIIAGFSLGNDPAIQLSDEVGHPAQDTYLFGAPQPSTGIFHNPYVDNPFVEPWLGWVGGLSADRPLRAGMQAFYDTKDPYANGAPQCGGPGWFAINVQTGHYIISSGQANEHVWTGPDGVVMHEANYVAPPGLPLSGSDPEPLWAFCPPNFPQQIPQSMPGAPIPGGSPIPSANGNMPAQLPLNPVPAPGG